MSDELVSDRLWMEPGQVESKADGPGSWGKACSALVGTSSGLAKLEVAGDVGCLLDPKDVGLLAARW